MENEYSLNSNGIVCNQDFKEMKRQNVGAGGPHTPKYLDQFLTVLLATFTAGLIFVRHSKTRVATLCFDRNYTLL